MVLSISVGFVKESKIIIKYISAIGKIKFSASLQIIVRVTNYNRYVIKVGYIIS